MKYSTLKKLSIAMCSLIMLLCSEVQSAQELTDSEIIASNKTKLFYQNEDTKLSEDELISPQTINLEESSASWTSYLFSPIKSAVYNTYSILNYTTKNPQKAIIAGLMLASQLIVVAADCECLCAYTKWEFQGPVEARKFLGITPDTLTCSHVCKENDYVRMSICVPRG